MVFDLKIVLFKINMNLDSNIINFPTKFNLIKILLKMIKIIIKFKEF